MHPRTLSAICLSGVLGLAACATPPGGPRAARNAVYATDLAGKAAVCVAAPVKVTDGKDVDATIATGGGGWCAITVSRNDDPLTAGLLTEAPRSGSVYVHTVGDDTRVDYTPRGAVVADSFSVKFIPGDETMHVTVTPAAAGAAK